MYIYAIGDLHLSGEPPKKPMEVFGDHWLGHKDKIKNDWLKKVTDEDIVIICGDISWAMGLKDVNYDLNWLAQLPGRKILLRGNHDYWWGSLSKMRQIYGDNFEFLQNNCILVNNIAICGTRGWILPSADKFTVEDEKIYQREGIRLKLALEEAKKYSPNEIIVAMHYPPLFASNESTLFTSLLEEYNVKYCLYGHIHGGDNHIQTFEGERCGVFYKLVSCDTQDFKLTKVI